MILPPAGFTTPAGVATGLRSLADIAGMPFTLYIKSEDYVDVDTLASLVGEGTLLAVKYSIVRASPAGDACLRRLLESVPATQVVSGMGERPALVRMRDFGLAAWTTGSDCVAPHAVMALLRAAKEGRADDARPLRDRFLPLVTLRNEIWLIRVLHDAVTLSGIAEMGPMLSHTPDKALPAIEKATRELRGFDRTLA